MNKETFRKLRDDTVIRVDKKSQEKNRRGFGTRGTILEIRDGKNGTWRLKKEAGGRDHIDRYRLYKYRFKVKKSLKGKKDFVSVMRRHISGNLASLIYGLSREQKYGDALKIIKRRWSGDLCKDLDLMTAEEIKQIYNFSHTNLETASNVFPIFVNVSRVS